MGKGKQQNASVWKTQSILVSVEKSKPYLLKGAMKSESLEFTDHSFLGFWSCLPTSGTKKPIPFAPPTPSELEGPALT